MGLAASPLGDLLAVDGVSRTYLLLADSGEASLLSDDFAECAFSFDSEVLYCFDHNERAIVGVDPISEDISETGLAFGEPEQDDCYSLVASPVRRLLASGGDHGRVRLGDPGQGRWLWIQDGPPGLVANLAFTPDGRVLVSGHASTLAFWDVATGNCMGKLTLPGEGLQALAFSPGGQTLAVGDSQGAVRLLPWRELLEDCVE
jgi:WD40 repeat protein